MKSEKLKENMIDGNIYNKTTFKVHRDAQEIPVKAKVDVLVCGGGPAGIGAALGAAKGEVSVMIIEKIIALGDSQPLDL